MGQHVELHPSVFDVLNYVEFQYIEFLYAEFYYVEFK